jgi:hypothetical protein
LDQLRFLKGGTIDRHFVSTATKKGFYVLHSPDPPSHGQRHEALIGKIIDQPEIRGPSFLGGTDIEKDQLIHLAQSVNLDGLQKTSHPPPAIEPDSLDKGEILIKECGNNTSLDHPNLSKR